MRKQCPLGLVFATLLALMLSQACCNAGDATTPRCGAANGQDHLRAAPSDPSQLCVRSAPSRVRGSGPWTWQCESPNGNQDACFAAPGALTVVYNVRPDANLKHINQEIHVARKLFKNSETRNTTFVLKFPRGVFDFSRYDSGRTIYCDPPGSCSGIPVFDISYIAPGPTGRLLILGAGLDQTKFIVSPDQIQFFGRKSRRITIEGIDLSQDRLEASQGTEVGTSVKTPDGTSNWVGIDISPGFPQMQPYPSGLWTARGHGRFLRRYLRGTSCTIDASFQQLPYEDVLPDSAASNRWWFHLTQQNPFSPGDLIGIKSKFGGGQAYFFAASDDIVFDDVRWTRRSRGVFRSGTTDVQIFDSQIIPDPPILGEKVCMASSGGGPQIGQPHDGPTWGNIIDNLRALNTGDDSIAVFNGHDRNGQVGISIRGTTIRNSFARSINLYHTPYEVPDGIDTWTLGHLFGCNPALPFGSPPHEPSVPGRESDVGFSECVLYKPN